MRCHRMVSVLIAMFAAIVMAPSAAHAEPYPAEPPPAEVSDGTVEPGGTITFSGSGMLPYETVSIDVGYSSSDNPAAFSQRSAGTFTPAAMTLAAAAVITTKADGDGNFSVQVPLTRVGTATIKAVGLTSGVTVETTVEVVSDDGDTGGGGGDDGNGGGDDGTDDGGNGGNGGNGGGDGDTDEDVTLPTTGPASSLPLLIAAGSGLGAIMIGTLLVWSTRGRRRDSTI